MPVRSFVLLGFCVGLGFSWPGQSIAAELIQRSGLGRLRLQAPAVAGDRALMQLSERLRIILEVEGQDTLRIEPPLKPLATAEWEILEQSRPSQLGVEKDRAQWRQEFVIAPVRPGELTLILNPLRIRRRADESGSEEIRWTPVPVHVSTQITSADLSELRPVTGPEELPADDASRIPVIWAWSALIIAGLLLAVARRLRKPTVIPEPSSPTRFADALAELEALDHHGIEDATALYITLSHEVRTCLQSAFGFHSPGSTTVEFLARLQDAPGLRPELGQMATQLLERCDMVKFARLVPSAEDCRRSLALAQRLLALAMEAGQEFNGSSAV